MAREVKTPRCFVCGEHPAKRSLESFFCSNKCAAAWACGQVSAGAMCETFWCPKCRSWVEGDMDIHDEREHLNLSDEQIQENTHLRFLDTYTTSR